LPRFWCGGCHDACVVSFLVPAGFKHTPFSQAAAAQAFLEQRLRMEDVRQYLLDTLRLYASLQTFQVGFRCFGAAM
jgi:Glycosyl transferase family 90